MFNVAHSCAEKFNTYSPRSSWSYLKEEETQSSITITGYLLLTLFRVISLFENNKRFADICTDSIYNRPRLYPGKSELPLLVFTNKGTVHHTNPL